MEWTKLKLDPEKLIDQVVEIAAPCWLQTAPVISNQWLNYTEGQHLFPHCFLYYEAEGHWWFEGLIENCNIRICYKNVQ